MRKLTTEYDLCIRVHAYIQLRFPIYAVVQVHELIENHNSLGRERPLGLDVKQSSNAQDAFRPIPDLISCAGVTGSCMILSHTCIEHNVLVISNKTLFFSLGKTVLACVSR